MATIAATTFIRLTDNTSQLRSKSFSLTPWTNMWASAVSLLTFATSAVLGSPLVRSIDALGKVAFTSTVYKDSALRYVNNSGICETTPGVHTMSGYVDIGANMSTWFWFFSARENPETAPLILWLNGGPGCSSMIGLFQENGPCSVNENNQTVLNPYSWNSVANVLYIDQPIGTGFSYGNDTVTSTASAAPQVWQALQLLFESGEFSAYKNRQFILATESYGGHFGPAFVTYFDQQNALIQSGKLQAEPVVVSALMINNGWFDPLLQNKAYVDYSKDAPGYGPIVNDTVWAQVNSSFYRPGGCLDQEIACYNTGPGGTESATSDRVCRNADNFCINEVFTPAIGNLDSYDIRQQNPDPYPPEFYLNYLAEPDVQAAIGADVTYQECPDAPYNLFTQTGDDARTWLPQLSKLADSKLKMLIWAGDADFNCNWLGVHAVVEAMNWYGNETLHNTPLTNVTIDGKPVAAVQNVDNFSFARVYEAGHEIPYYQPQAALEFLKQIIAGEQIHSV